jgi:hypothetical protein
MSYVGRWSCWIIWTFVPGTRTQVGAFRNETVGGSGALVLVAV